MESGNMQTNFRLAGYAAIGGSVIMFIGAAFWGTSGADLWASLDMGDMAGYLVAAGAVKPQLIINLSLWILGVLILGMAGEMLVSCSGTHRGLAQAAAVCFRTAVPLAIVSFIAMLALVVRIAPDTSAVAVLAAETVGWIGVRADDLATALIVGVGPFFIALAARDDWMPAWLARWGYLAGVVGLFSVVVLYLPPLSPFGLLIVPVGLGWMIAAGVVLLRRARVAETNVFNTRRRATEGAVS